MVSRTSDNLGVLLARGEGRAMWEIISQYKDRLVNYFHRHVGDRHIAEDLAQEVFVRVFRKAESFRDGMPFEPWLFTIARNLTVDHVRKVGRRAKESSNVPEQAGGSEDPSRKLEKEEIREIVQEEIRKMPEKYRSALVLCELEGFSCEAASGILGVSSKTVGARLSRARDILRRRMSKYNF